MSKCLHWGKRFKMESIYSEKDIGQLAYKIGRTLAGEG